MAVNLDTFIASFPEFEPAGCDLIETKLAEAVLQIDTVVWGGHSDLGVKYLTAHLLALSPFGKDMRLEKDDQLTVYWGPYRRLLVGVAGGYRVP